MKPFFLCEPVSYSAKAVLPTPEKLFLEKSSELSRGPSTVSVNSKTMLRMLNCLARARARVCKCACVRKCTCMCSSTHTCICMYAVMQDAYMHVCRYVPMCACTRMCVCTCSKLRTLNYENNIKTTLQKWLLGLFCQG